MGASSHLQRAHRMGEYTLAELEDQDAIKTLVATSLTAQSYSGAALNGARANPGPATARIFPQAVSVTTTTDAATYNTTDAITITGTDENDATLTDTLLLTQAGGNETVVGTKGFKTVTTIAIPAQLTTNGAFEFGFSDIVLSAERPGIMVRHGSAGNIVLGFDGGFTDVIVGAVTEKHEALIRRVVRANSTSDPITVYQGRGAV